MICGHWATGTAFSLSTSGFPKLFQKHTYQYSHKVVPKTGRPGKLCDHRTVPCTTNHLRTPLKPWTLAAFAPTFPSSRWSISFCCCLLCDVVSVSGYITPSLDTPFLGIMIQPELVRKLWTDIDQRGITRNTTVGIQLASRYHHHQWDYISWPPHRELLQRHSSVAASAAIRFVWAVPLKVDDKTYCIQLKNPVLVW